MNEILTETQFTVELEEEIHNYIALAVQYQEELTVKNFISHLEDKYSGN
ncbi:MAG TPA: hypothetical protein VL020_01125 [Pseudomonadales bacterium]|nr:hypothetical protein [Pseudomonadales bacterium]